GVHGGLHRQVRPAQPGRLPLVRCLRPGGRASLEDSIMTMNEKRTDKLEGKISLRRRAEAEWNGDLIHGSGRLTVGSGALDVPYSVKSRFEDGHSATNPEELLGAAHAGCFTMARAAQLSRAGFVPTHIHTGATVTVEKLGDAF